MNNFSKKIIWINLLILFLFVLDRVLKWLALNTLPRNGIFLIKKITGFILERNQGIAYSITLPHTILLVAVSIIIFILMILLVKTYKRREYLIIFALSLIIVGAISNLIDRLRYDYVIDLITITSWPVFNLADVMITAGVVLILWRMAKKGNKEHVIDNK